jgi:hypothetical protein
MGAELHVHDPYVDHWFELEIQDTYPAPGLSWKRFFRNQEGLKSIRVQKNLSKALKDVEVVIFAVPHKLYLELRPDDVVKWVGQPFAVIDCYGILSDDKIKRYIKLGCEVKGLGRGHIKRLKDEVAKR